MAKDRDEILRLLPTEFVQRLQANPNYDEIRKAIFEAQEEVIRISSERGLSPEDTVLMVETLLRSLAVAVELAVENDPELQVEVLQEVKELRRRKQ